MHFKIGFDALLCGMVCTTLPAMVGAQTAKDSALYVQAQEMVANGDASNGRRLADSVASAAAVGSAEYAEGLFWKATLAEDSRDSEHAYRQIIVDYPSSGRVPNALLRLGQLESARGQNADALQHFQRLVLEHPQSPLHAEASYWVAHTYFATNDMTRACTASADALANVGASNIELRNRIDFQQQRCRGVAIAPNAAPTPVPVTVRVNKTPEAAKTNGVVSRAPTKGEVDQALASAERTKGSYAVQVAAFATKSAAKELVAKMHGRGYDAYIVGTRAPYRVRIGHYGTHATAAAALVKLKARKIDGFVAEK